MNAAIIGLGINTENEPLGDIWLLNLNTYQWQPFPTTGAVISPRVDSRAVILDDTMYVFGGGLDRELSNELYAVNLRTGECIPVTTDGDIPTPRSSPLFAGFGSELFVWGGSSNGCPSELHVLDLTTHVWTSIPQDLPGRPSIAYSIVGDRVYGYGGSNTGGILLLNMSEKTAVVLPTTGPEPPSSTANGSLVHFDNYLMFVGGIAPNQWSLLYCLDLRRSRWFVFHVLPDGSTVSVVDGHISDLGLFQLPRTHSMGIVYNPAKREVVGLLGAPIECPARLFVIQVGEALSCLHLRTDMLMSCAYVEE